MNRMRKGLAALAAAVFFLGVGGVAQAVIGVPDDVPGSTLLFPFFKVNPTRTATDTQDTLLVVTNTAGATSSFQSGVSPNVAVHVTLWNVSSEHLYDFTILLTPHDVWSCSLYDLILGPGCEQAATAPLSVRDRLLGTIDGSPALIGYATADVVYSTPTFLFPGQSNYPFGYGNVLIGHMYLVNLINGSSTGFNAVSIETEEPCYGHNAVSVAAADTANSRGFYRTRCEEEQGAAACAPPAGPVASTCPAGGGGSFSYGDFTERIDGPNGDWAQTQTAAGHGGIAPLPPHAADSPLSLLIRYFSATVLEARTEVWLWKDRVAGSGGNINVAVYDENENAHSITLRLPDEVNFALTNQIITPGVSGGWFRVTYACGNFGSCTYSYVSPSGGSSAPRPPLQSVAYSVQFAQSSNATLRWDATFPAHRQYTNYRGISG